MLTFNDISQEIDTRMANSNKGLMGLTVYSHHVYYQRKQRLPCTKLYYDQS